MGACAEAITTASDGSPTDPAEGGVTMGDASTPDDTKSDAGGSQRDAAKDAAKDAADAAPLNFCAALAAQASSCGEPAPVGCAKQEACMNAVVHPASLQTLKTCLTTLSCTASKLSCDEAAAQAHASEPSYLAYKAACAQALTTCGASSPFKWWCAPIMAEYAPIVLDGFKTCFSGACEDVQGCLDAKNAALGCE